MNEALDAFYTILQEFETLTVKLSLQANIKGRLINIVKNLLNIGIVKVSVLKLYIGEFSAATICNHSIDRLSGCIISILYIIVQLLHGDLFEMHNELIYFCL